MVNQFYAIGFVLQGYQIGFERLFDAVKMNTKFESTIFTDKQCRNKFSEMKTKYSRQLRFERNVSHSGFGSKHLSLDARIVEEMMKLILMLQISSISILWLRQLANRSSLLRSFIKILYLFASFYVYYFIKYFLLLHSFYNTDAIHNRLQVTVSRRRHVIRNLLGLMTLITTSR